MCCRVESASPCKPIGVANVAWLFGRPHPCPARTSTPEAGDVHKLMPASIPAEVGNSSPVVSCLGKRERDYPAENGNSVNPTEPGGVGLVLSPALRRHRWIFHRRQQAQL